MKKIEHICVYCSSSDALEKQYYELASVLGSLFYRHNKTLVYGGASVGLMGVVANKVLADGGSVIGVIPELIHSKGISNTKCTELIVTENMRERKAKMENISDAFIAMPGGFGTLEEISEIITAKQLNIIDKPVVFLNIDGFYDSLFSFFDGMFEKNFTKKEYRNLYYFTDSADDAMQYICNYKSFVHTDKWFKSVKYPETDLKDNVVDLI